MKKFLSVLFLTLALPIFALASISVQTNKIWGSGDGNTTSFTFPFKIFKSSDLKVYQLDSNSTVYGPYNLTTDYTVAISSTSEGGFVNFTVAPQASWQTFIERVEPLTQALTISTEGPLPAKQIENQLDLQMMAVQQINESAGRAVQLPVTTNITNNILPTPMAGYAIGWDSTGQNLSNVATTGTAIPVPIPNTYLFSDTDGTLVNNSDNKLATQKAIKTYADTKLKNETPLDYSNTSTIVGWVNYSSKKIYTTKIGKRVFVDFYLSGVSNNTATTFTVSDAANVNMDTLNTYLSQDNASTFTITPVKISSNSTNVICYTSGFGNWTASGIKQAIGQISYESQ